jgi:hypothetical protein
LTSLKTVLKDYVRYNFPLEQITEKYTEWVSEDTYMILSKWNKDKSKNDVFAVKCSKRGNDVYHSRVEKRFKSLTCNADKLVFFNRKDRGEKHTSALWVTLTYDPKICSYKDAWENIGSEFNSFMAYIRSDFGKVSSLRVWESFENGYPHIHCILLFEKYSFSVFRDHKGNFRVKEKDVISAHWHSYTDVKAMDSLVGGFGYLKKYLLKSINYENADSKALRTLALCWLFGKRAFSVSGKFKRMLTDLITNLHNSKKHLSQVTLYGEIIPQEKSFLLGFVSGKDIKIDTNVWFTFIVGEQLDLLNEFLRKYERW